MLTPQILRALFLLAAFVVVFIVVQTILRLTVDKHARTVSINRRLRMIEGGVEREQVVSALLRNDPTLERHADTSWGKVLRPLRRNLLMAALPFGPSLVMPGMLGLFVALALMIAIFAYNNGIALSLGVIQLIGAVAAAAAIGMPLLAFSFLAQRRRRKMQTQFPVALDIFVRALRSGHPVASAIELLTKEMEDPIGSEFGLVGDEISYGAEMTEALAAMAERWDLDDIRMFVVSLSVQNETGGNLAEILENLSGVIRDRATLLLKVRALSSEGRMTGWLLTALPVVTFLALFVSDPGFYFEVSEDPIFYLGFPMIFLLFLLGVFWIHKLINIKV